MNKQKLGVIIGRFQVPELHEGHKKLINTVQDKTDKVLILIGSRDGEYTDKDALSYEIRKEMINDEYPNINMKQLYDRREDEDWSKEVDSIIESEYANWEVILYGSRDSFIPYYSGKFKVKEINHENIGLSGTDMRKEIFDNPKNNADFRRGMIYANQVRYAVAYQVTDIAILNKEKTKVLLGKKRDCNNFQFFGGYVDPTDKTLEEAAKREVEEETNGIKTGEYKYLFSSIIDDFRYWGQRDKIMTIFFVTEFISGKPQGSDDIEKVEWFDIDNLDEALPVYHQELGKKLKEYLQK